MKRFFIMGALVLLSAVTFSCTADEFETQTKNEVKKNINPVTPAYADGPDDGPIIVPPPPK